MVYKYRHTEDGEKDSDREIVNIMQKRMALEREREREREREIGRERG